MAKKLPSVWLYRKGLENMQAGTQVYLWAYITPMIEDHVEYIPAWPVRRLVEAVRNLRAFCIPGIDWSDDIATAALYEYDTALAAVEEGEK